MTEKIVKLGLSQLIFRNKILLMGATASGKSWNTLTFVKAHPKQQFFMIDPDSGISENIKKLGGEKAFPNLEYRLAVDWKTIAQAYEEAKKYLNQGDWLIAEHIGRWWELAQSFYTEYRYKIALAEKQLKAAGGVLIGGLDGNEWVETRRQHNSVVYPLGTRDPFNVLATTNLTEIQEFRVEKMSPAQKKQIEIFEELGWRPAGEKHMPELFSDIVLLMRKRIVVKGKAEYIYAAQYAKHRGEPMSTDEVVVEKDVSVVDMVLKGEL